MRSDYAYITGKIRQLENGLPNETDLERMIDAPNAQAAFEVLNDTDYASQLLNVEYDNYYKVLRDNWREFRKMLKDAVPDQRLLDILYLREDFNNLKIVLKHFYRDMPLKEARTTDSGSVSLDDWVSHFDPDISNNLEPKWVEVIDLIIRYLSSDVNSQEIDHIVDRVYMRTYMKWAKKFKNEFIIRMASIEIDVMNIKALIRAKRLKRSSEWLLKQLARGGTISIDEIVSWLEMDQQEYMQQFQHRLPYTIYKEIEKGQQNGVTEVIEHALYTWRRKYVSRARYVAYGPEPVVRYFYAKIRAMVNIRVVMSGKINNINSEELRKRIRV